MSGVREDFKRLQKNVSYHLEAKKKLCENYPLPPSLLLFGKSHIFLSFCDMIFPFISKSIIFIQMTKFIWMELMEGEYLQQFLIFEKGRRCKAKAK